MVIYLVDGKNNPLHPTKKLDMIRRWIKQNKAEIAKLSENIILIQVFKIFDKSKTINCEFRIGIDPGYKNIGFALFKIYKDSITKLFSGEVNTRTSEVTKLLLERKMYRNSRRYYRRKNVKRKFNHAKFRNPIWKNRKKRHFQPTHIHLINSHWSILNKIFKLIPLDQSKIHIEYSKFDIHKIINPKVFSWKYQKGIQYGFENVKSYVRDRDDYTCQICKTSKNIVLEVHHIIERNNNGSDRPDNLITLCSKCHDKVHRGINTCPNIKSKQFKDMGVLNSCMKFIYETLSQYIPTQDTYGYITKSIRLASNIDKTHANDASIIAFCDSLELQDINSYKWIDHNISVNFKQYRRHVRTHTKRHEDRKYYIEDYQKNKTLAWNRKRREGQVDKKKISLIELKRLFRKNNLNINIKVKPGKTVTRYSNTDVKFRPGDIIKYSKIIDVCKGWASTQRQIICENLDKIKERLCQKKLNNSGMVFSSSSPP